MNRSESKYFNTAAKMDLALIKLLKRKPLEYITVSELCQAAQVNRSTFYLHYETIGDLLDEAARYLLDDFLSYFPGEMRAVAHNLETCALEELVFITDKYLSPYLTYIRDHKEVFGTVLAHNKTLGFEGVYRQLFQYIFNPVLERFHYPAADRNYVMMYYLNGINAIVVEWLKDGCSKPVDEVAKIITVCIYGKEIRL